MGWGVTAAPLPTAAVLAVMLAARKWRRAVAVTRRSRAADTDTVLLAELAPGRHVFRYVMRAEQPGRYHVMPAVAQLAYFPEARASSREARLTVERER